MNKFILLAILISALLTGAYVIADKYELSLRMVNQQDCPACGLRNKPFSSHCVRCGRPLGVK